MNLRPTSRRAVARGLLAVLAVLSFGHAAGQAVPPLTAIGWELFRSNRPLPAAEAWTQAAGQAAQRRSNVGKREAAFAHVLASMAYEQAGDERAYASWADAVRLYLELGLTWDREREELRNRWRNLERQLVQASSGVTPTLAADEQMFADLVQRAGLLDYKGPRPGLRDRRNEDAEISSITPQYFSGAGRVDSSSDVADPQSRYGAVAAAPAAAAPGAIQIGARSLAGATPAIGRFVASGVVPAPGSASPAARPEAPAAEAPAAAPPETPAGSRIVHGRLAAVDATPPQPSSALARRGAGLPRQFQHVAGKPRALTSLERAAAQQAWRYVLANRQSATGLVNGKDSYPVSSVADIAQTIAAYHSALALQFIEREGFEADMRQLLGTLRELPLYNRELYNRDYDSRTGRMLDLGARSSELGSGWAAEDIGRLLLWLRVLGNTAPDLAPAGEAVVGRLRLSRLVSGGLLYSALNQDGREQVFSDLRLGRQQATAAALSLWGVLLPAMLGYDEAVLRRVGTVVAPGDKRDGGAVSPEVFARVIVELGGIDGCFEAAARNMLVAQHTLAARRGAPVMIADELLDRAPWFVYGSLASGGQEWRVNDFDQQPQPALANFSVKAAHLWAAIDSSAPTLAARGLADSLERSDRGLYGGRYLDGRTNLALSLDTNASVLLAANYAQRGGQPLLRVDNPVDHACAGLHGEAK
jgi:hypothetical protein